MLPLVALPACGDDRFPEQPAEADVAGEWGVTYLMVADDEVEILPSDGGPGTRTANHADTTARNRRKGVRMRLFRRSRGRGDRLLCVAERLELGFKVFVLNARLPALIAANLAGCLWTRVEPCVEART